ncbi:MAG: hypothetical protein WBB41_02815 [Candidatus Nanopelagicales bacterium]
MKRLAGALLAVAATVSLASCEKPPPRVTVFSGTTSQWVAPTCFSWEGDIDAQQCLTQAAERVTQGQTKRLNVIPEKVVGISVDPSVAESGWYPTVGGQRLTQDTLNETYFRFSFPRVPASPQGYPLAIVSEGEQKGVWVVRLDVQPGS